jgi:hypothetical protein
MPCPIITKLNADLVDARDVLIEKRTEDQNQRQRKAIDLAIRDIDDLLKVTQSKPMLDVFRLKPPAGLRAGAKAPARSRRR